MTSPAETTVEREQAIAAFGDAVVSLQAALLLLDQAGLDAVSALKEMKDTEGNSIYEAMPLQVRLLLG